MAIRLRRLEVALFGVVDILRTEGPVIALIAIQARTVLLAVEIATLAGIVATLDTLQYDCSRIVCSVYGVGTLR